MTDCHSKEVEVVLYPAEEGGCREFYSKKEAADFLGMKEVSLVNAITKGCLTKAGWYAFNASSKIIQIEETIGRNV